MQATGIFDVNNAIKRTVFQKWQEEDIADASPDTSAKIMGIWSQATASTQTQLINPSFLTKVADGWQSIKNYLLENPFNPLPDSSHDITSFEKRSLLFNEDVIKFCSQSGIVTECFKYHDIFIDTFKNLQGITITVSHDYELPDYAKINFVLTLSDEIENVLKYENEFRCKIRQEIDRGKRRYFTYNYILI